MLNKKLFCLCIGILLLFSGCFLDDYNDYEGYFAIPEHHTPYLKSYPDTLSFISGDSVIHIFTHVTYKLEVKEGMADYAEHRVYWDYEDWSRLYACGDIEIKLSISFRGNPYELYFPVVYYFDFQFPENLYKLEYWFDNPDTINFCNDSIVELESRFIKDHWSEWRTTAQLRIRRSEGILSFEGLGDDMLYKYD